VSAERHVVVVGGGLAGLAAAFAHARRGARVTLLERAARVGGRAAADAAGSDPIAARVTSADRGLVALVRDAGVADALLPIRPVRSVRVADGRIAGAAPSGDPRSLIGVAPVQALRLFRLERLLARYRVHLDPAAPERAAPLDDRSLADFATLYFGRAVTTAWIEPWLAERAPVDEREVSRAAFLLRWHAERGAVSGAFGAPLERLFDALVSRLSLRAQVAAERVEPGSAGRLRVVTAYEGIDADAVVLAVPAPEALRIADPVLVAAERSVLGGVRYDAAISWRAPLRAAIEPARVRLARRGAHPFASIAIESDSVVAIARDPWARAHLDVADDALGKELAAALAHVLPGIAEEHGVARRFALAWPRFDVGRYRAIARLRAVEADRRAAGRPLFFAGDWLAAPTLDGAVASAQIDQKSPDRCPGLESAC